ncbi:phage protease [Sulfurimonas sp.]|uniref:phage protease n=1 Tax=Sulfurimonas sp. TaxID=2022749 RepID=UPI0025D03B03|nr:phage protease [Sulfurimonas sp.]
MNKSLIACNLLFALARTTDASLLDEVKIAVVGSWRGHSTGPFELTPQDLEQIKTNFDNSNIDIVADFEHASLWNEKAPATGWVKELYINKDELWAKIKWLDDAKELIKSEQYKYISPVFDQHTIQVSGEDIGWSLHSLALTNRPFLEELGEVIANHKNSPHQKKETEMGMTPEEKKEFDNLKLENQTLKDTAATAEVKRVEDEVDSAIAAKKVSPKQKEALLAFGKQDAEGLTKLITAAKPIMQKPGDNLYPNSRSGGSQDEPYDVLKLGGIEDE